MDSDVVCDEIAPIFLYSFLLSQPLTGEKLRFTPIIDQGEWSKIHTLLCLTAIEIIDILGSMDFFYFGYVDKEEIQYKFNQNVRSFI